MSKLIIEICPECGGTMDNNLCPYCDVFVDGVCPECGEATLCNNDPGKEVSDPTWCSSKACPYYVNQFMYWEDIKPDFICPDCGSLMDSKYKCHKC